MKILWSLLAVLTIPGAIPAQTPLDLQKVMPKKLEHPFLYFRTDELPAMRRRVETHPRARAVYLALVRDCDRLLDMPVTFRAPKGSVMREGRHAFYPENRQAEFFWIPFYDLAVKAESERTLIANLFLPVEDEAEAQSVLRASTLSSDGDKLECVVNYRGRRLRAKFELSHDGIKLK